MLVPSTSVYPLTSNCHIAGLSDHSANFMSARSRQRAFLPQQGSHWWRFEFCSAINLEQFISDIYLFGFYGEIQVKGLVVEIQSHTDLTATMLRNLTGREHDLSLSELKSDVVTICNDTHALLCNSKNSGALVFAGEQTCNFEFDAKPSAWLVLEELSHSIDINDIIHFDPRGHLIVRGGEEVRLKITDQLYRFTTN